LSFAQDTSHLLNQKIEKLQARLLSLQAEYKQLQPKRPYIIVNTSENNFSIHDGQFDHRAKCSTGSYILLKANGRREWLFKTPRGVFRITVKLKDPVWYKPDWAFIEERLSIPPPDSPKRYQYGVLGDYAVAFGQGYLIHGTLYKRLLGMPVTHGCVRLDDYDIKIVYDKIHHGSKVYIF
jgi:L,D-transpeptidase YbiS